MSGSSDRQSEAQDLRAHQGMRVTWIGVAINAALTIAKAAGGILGGSQALLADALHSLSDLVSDVVVLFALKFSSEPADQRHPYGHGRMEIAAAFCVGLILLMAGFYMFYRSISDLWIPRPYRLNFLVLPFILLAIALKEGLYWATLRVGRRTLNQALIANAWHHRSDAISSVAALGGVTIALMGYWRADAIAAMGVAGLVIWIGGRISREALDDLLDAAPTDDVLARIRVAIEDVEGVESIHALRTRRVGSYFFVDVHIQVKAALSVAEGHFIAHQGQDAVLSKVDEVSEVIVHVEPDTLEGSHEK